LRCALRLRGRAGRFARATGVAGCRSAWLGPIRRLICGVIARDDRLGLVTAGLTGRARFCVRTGCFLQARALILRPPVAPPPPPRRGAPPLAPRGGRRPAPPGGGRGTPPLPRLVPRRRTARPRRPAVAPVRAAACRAWPGHPRTGAPCGPSVPRRPRRPARPPP